MPYFGICKHHMDPYCIKHQHQETANHSEHSFAHCPGCTQDTNTQYLHEETGILPMDAHLILHATQLKLQTQMQTHPLHDLIAHSNPPRNRKVIFFY